MTPVALVTGAGGGIGSAIAARLTDDGWSVVVVDLDGSRASRVADRLERAVAFELDVTDQIAVQALIADIDATLGRLDLVVNNAGVELRAPLADHTPGDWDRVMAVNLDAAFIVSGAALAGLRRARGAVVNIASIAAIGTGGQVAYDTSKGALVGLTRSMARDLRDERVRVNAVCPGFIDTPMLDDAGLRQIAERVARRLPLRRVGRASEVAAAVAFLGGDAAGHVTGQVLFVDGGMVRH